MIDHPELEASAHHCEWAAGHLSMALCQSADLGNMCHPPPPVLLLQETTSSELRPKRRVC